MSKSLKRVIADARKLGLNIDIQEMQNNTHTAVQAALAVNCDVGQIAKSVIFQGLDTHKAVLFLTGGNNRVDVSKASQLAGEDLGKADAAIIREQTGFAIGGVSPLGHLTAIRCFFDPGLLAYKVIWVAAGTPRHMFAIDPAALLQATQGIAGDFTI